MIIVGLLIVIPYLLFILAFYVGFDKVSEIRLEDKSPEQKFSILIPFRNEMHALPDLIESIELLSYSRLHYEIIFIDDDSSDQSVEILGDFIGRINLKSKVNKIHYRILKNKRVSASPKKDAISLGIENAKYDYIVVTDADVKVPKYWLDAFDQCLKCTDAKMIIAPVIIADNSTFIKRFQILDFLSLQGATIGSMGLKLPFLCNGANLCYDKHFFNSVEGFQGNNHIASGDDIFLLEKVLQYYPKQITYLKSAKSVVITNPVSKWKGLIDQHHRWAAKAGAVNLFFGKLVGLVILLMNLWIVIALPFGLFGVISAKPILLILFIKISVDFLLIFKTSRFFQNEEALLSFPISSLIYPFFSTYIVFLSIFKSYRWKDRVFSK